MRWIIQEDSFPQELQALYETLDKNNVKYTKVKEEADLKKINPYWVEPAFFYGSLQWAKKIYLESDIDVFYSPTDFTCRNYYPILGEFLLNGNYVMLPFNELKRQKEFLFHCVGEDRAIFLRPDREDKIFTGTLVYKEDYEEQVDYWTGYAFKRKINLAEELVIASEPKNLAFEWRFVIINGLVSTGSQYRENNRVASDASYTEEAMQFAQVIANKYKPDTIFIVDVCLTKAGNYHLMEIGPFSCAGLYACNLDIIVKGIEGL